MKTNYFYAIENIMPSKKLRRVILCVTNICNSRCRTCSLWKNKIRKEPLFEDLKNLASSEFFRKIRFLTLTGGEPFLRKDLDRVVNMFREKNPKMSITILSNALMPDLIIEKAMKMPKDVLITLSFNGKEETHDETRGIKGNFQGLLKTLDGLKEIGQNTNLIFTVTKENYDQILWAWNFAKERNINILFSPEMNYGRLHNETNRGLSENQKKIVMSQLKQIYSERKRPFFDDTYMIFFKKVYEGKIVTDLCYAGTNSIYVDYTGDIYPCENLAGAIAPLGNISDGKITLPKNYIQEIKKMKCYENCYLLCEMVRNMRKHPVKIFRERNK